MEYQQAQVRPARLTRVNWTQTTTILIAAFIGCLAAFALVAVAYKSKVGQALREKLAKLDQVQQEIDQANEDLREVIDTTAQLDERYRQLNRRTAQSDRPETTRMKPVTNKYPEPVQRPWEVQEVNDDDDDAPETGEPVPTIPTV